jgi:hypothetical protein
MISDIDIFVRTKGEYQRLQAKHSTMFGHWMTTRSGLLQCGQLQSVAISATSLRRIVSSLLSTLAGTVRLWEAALIREWQSVNRRDAGHLLRVAPNLDAGMPGLSGEDFGVPAGHVIVRAMPMLAGNYAIRFIENPEPVNGHVLPSCEVAAFHPTMQRCSLQGDELQT